MKISLKKYEELMKLQAQNLSETDFAIKSMALVYDLKEEQVEAFKISDFTKKYKEILDILNKKPHQTPAPKIEIAGEEYFVTLSPFKMTLGQYIDCQTVLEKMKRTGDTISYMHELISCLLMHKKDGYTGNLELAGDMDFMDAYPIFLFFSTYKNIILKITDYYLKKEAKKLKKMEEKLVKELK